MGTLVLLAEAIRAACYIIWLGQVRVVGGACIAAVSDDRGDAWHSVGGACNAAVSGDRRIAWQGVGCTSIAAVSGDRRDAWHGRGARMFGCSVVGLCVTVWPRITRDTKAGARCWYRLGKASRGRESERSGEKMGVPRPVST